MCGGYQRQPSDAPDARVPICFGGFWTPKKGSKSGIWPKSSDFWQKSSFPKFLAKNVGFPLRKHPFFAKNRVLDPPQGGVQTPKSGVLDPPGGGRTPNSTDFGPLFGIPGGTQPPFGGFPKKGRLAPPPLKRLFFSCYGFWPLCAVNPY